MRIAALFGVVLGAIACVDQETETAVYTHPCGTIWRAALLCDRENGGADPQTPGGGPAPSPAPVEPVDTSCEAVCDLLAACLQITDPAQIAQCVMDCQFQSTPDERECVIMSGCNFEMCFPMPV